MRRYRPYPYHPTGDLSRSKRRVKFQPFLLTHAQLNSTDRYKAFASIALLLLLPALYCPPPQNPPLFSHFLHTPPKYGFLISSQNNKHSHCRSHFLPLPVVPIIQCFDSHLRQQSLPRRRQLRPSPRRQRRPRRLPRRLPLFHSVCKIFKMYYSLDLRRRFLAFFF